MNQPQQHRLALPPGTMLEEYRIEAVLGKGGFGITYLAIDVRLQMRVAIKELLPSQFATRLNGLKVEAMTSHLEQSYLWAVRRFEEEARVLGRLSHPNIVRILRSFPLNNTVYLVMEYIEGVSLKQHLSDTGCLDESRSVELLRPLLIGLQYVHAQGLLHRDVKPDNIFLTREGRVVLLDFGSARQDIGQSVSRTTLISKGYSPFEQYSSRGKQGPWTDIYALAATTVFMLVGRALRDATDRYANPEPAGWLKKDLGSSASAQFSSALEHALAPVVNDRPQSITDWHQEVLRSTTPLPPPPVSPSLTAVSHVSPRLPHTLRGSNPEGTRWALAIPVAIIAILLLGLIGWLVWDLFPSVPQYRRSSSFAKPAASPSQAAHSTPDPDSDFLRPPVVGPPAEPRPAPQPQESWTPGSPHPSYPNVIAGDSRDDWYPRPGYTWVTNPPDGRVKWLPSNPHPTVPHVIAGDREDTWDPEPGYAWASGSQNDFRVVPLGDTNFKKLLVDFAIAFAELKGRNSPDIESTIYHDPCAFNGSQLTRSEVLYRLQKLNENWPAREYDVKDIVDVNKGPTQAEVTLTIVFDYQWKDSRQTKSGSGRWQIRFKNLSSRTNPPVITSFFETTGR